MGLIIDVLRSFLWALTYALFMIGDAVYSVTIKVGSMNVGELNIVWDWWVILSVMIGSISMIRILILGVRYMVDEEMREKMDVFKIFGRVIFVSLAIALMPLGIKTITSAGQTFVQNVGLVAGYGNEMVPSTLIISSVMGEAFDVQDENGGYSIPKTYKLEDIDINHETNGEYTYFKEMGDLFVLIIIGGIAIVGLILIAIEVAERFFKLGIKILISPLPISGLINPGDESFKKWYRLVIADVVLNGIQILSLLFILSVASSNQIRMQGVWITLVMFIGGIFAVLKGVPELTPIIGGDSSTQGALQQIATIRHATSGIGKSVGGIGKSLGGGLKTAGAGIGYGVGRMMGGKSISDLESNNRQSSKTHAQATNGFKSGGQDVRNSNTESVRTSQSNFGNDDGSININEVNESRFTSGSEAKSQVDDFKAQQQNQRMESMNEPKQSESKNGAFRDYPQSKRDSNSEREKNTLGKGNTLATKIDDRAKGKKSGQFAKVANYAGRHVYQSSVNRLNQTLPGRAATMYRNAKHDIYKGDES